MASRAWSPDEIAILEQHIDRRDWFDTVAAVIGYRSPASLRWMMQKIRADMGVSDTRFVESAWMADAHNGSKRLLAAIQLAGLRPS